VKLVYTEQAIVSLNDCLDFISTHVTIEKLLEIRDRILDTADLLLDNPKLGQEEEYLVHLGLGHRRLIEGNYKIIYRVQGE
jgi:plasmid stabilization system protein ParE